MRRIAVHLGLIAVALACLPAAATASSEPRLQRVLATALARQPVSPGIAAAVYRPGLRWRGAAGVLDRASSLPLRPSDGYRIASITKTFTAAAILRLVERGELALGAPVARYLPAGYKRALRAGGYDPSRITVRMLLRHTAGLFDHSADDAYLQALLADPGHRWSRIEQVRFAMEHGEPVAPPGRRYSYSDTGYLLLGQIVESVSGSPQASVYRQLLRLRRLGVDATYFETLEPKPPGAGRQAHQYFGDLDTTEVLDPSHDLFGGGGLVSTVSDLNRFYRALFEGPCDQPRKSQDHDDPFASERPRLLRHGDPAHLDGRGHLLRPRRLLGRADRLLPAPQARDLGDRQCRFTGQSRGRRTAPRRGRYPAGRADPFMFCGRE